MCIRDRAKAYLETVRDANVALFGTLGAWPDSDHARDCIAQGEALVNAPERRNRVIGTYLCPVSYTHLDVYKRQVYICGHKV